VTGPVVEIAAISKAYGGLRPLRVQQLSVGAEDRIAILGFDAPAAEVFVNLVTGASLPDSGEVRIFGRATSAIADSADWLATVDRFGIVSERAVLLEQLTVIQNLAMPFTLDIEPPDAGVRQQAEALAAEVGLPPATWTRPAAELDAVGRLRARLARALALGPHVLLLEHASPGCEKSAADGVGRQIRAIGERRRIAILAATADARFARAVASRVVTLEAATGRLVEPSPRRWFGLP